MSTVQFTAGADTVVATNQYTTDTLLLLGGDDVVYVLPNNSGQVLDGGAGIDTINWFQSELTSEDSPPGVRFDLTTGTFVGYGGILGPPFGIYISYGPYSITANNFENAIAGYGNDTIIGTVGANYLDGNFNDDLLQSGGGNDTLIGGDGIDTASWAGTTASVFASLDVGTFHDALGATGILSGIENLVGGSGADNLVSGVAAARLEGGTGADVLYGNTGADTLDGGSGADLLSGGSGSDLYFVDNAGDVVVERAGAAGNDTVEAATSYALGEGIEVLRFTDSAVGGPWLFGTGASGAERLIGNAAANWLAGGGGNDTVSGGDGADALFGDAGQDSLSGDAGQDTLAGGEGDDTLDGGTGADELRGEAGYDSLQGGSDFATDILSGGDGNDTIDGGLAWDLMDGGAGDDLFYASQQVDWVFEAAGGGSDTVIASAADGYYLYANVEDLVLAGTTPYGVGNALANRITGNDRGNWLLGGAGDDTLDGGAGWDVLFGEAGADRFVFAQGTGGDVIGDFAAGTDRIDLSAFSFASYAAVQARMTQAGPDMAIDLGFGDFIVLQGVSIGSLSAGDFIL